ncbi:methylmalonate-semialdehyde dehydrogenase [Klebsiella pneumoniae]|uniref:Methylmalonate-semialdehyde dehydrogenase n=1 Tax=Klebsiella pneumoniae TaxID=573 RepID=A0A2X3ETC8_KLEPN|nr:methylmalonate-semialdehyde dehydrogenase [Klebsiella pneumoniae]
MTITGNFIGGKTVISSSNETMPVYDPATAKRCAKSRCQPRRKSPRRFRLLAMRLTAGPVPRRCAAPACCSTSKCCWSSTWKELAGIIVSEHGKVWSDALGELTRGMEVGRIRLRDPAPD